MSEFIEYEAIPSADARRVRRMEELRAAGRGWVYVVGAAVAGAVFLTLTAWLISLLPVTESDFSILATLLLGLMLGFPAGWWLRGRLTAPRSSARRTGTALSRVRSRGPH